MIPDHKSTGMVKMSPENILRAGWRYFGILGTGMEQMGCYPYQRHSARSIKGRGGFGFNERLAPQTQVRN